MDSGFQETGVTVVKVGGALLDSHEDRTILLDRLAAMEGPVVLVHGGGPQADRVGRALGVEPKMHRGRRVTDPATLKVVTMVYAGLNSKGVVAGLAARGVDAVGLCGADLDLMRAVRRPVGEVDYGFVGDVLSDQVNLSRLTEMLRSGITPVFSALTHDGAGQLLNTNADTIATTLARALSSDDSIPAVRLLLIMEAPGLLVSADDTASRVSSLSVARAREMIMEGALSGGILPKVENSIDAVESGVDLVRMGDLQMLLDERAGTRIVIDDVEEDRSVSVWNPPGSVPVEDAINLLRQLISTPSFSREEAATAGLIVAFLEAYGYASERCGNNVWSRGSFDPAKPTILLNSHHDTVRPSSGYTRSPFEPYEEDGRLYGLGSNDAGGPLMALLALFVEYGKRDDLPVNLLFGASAEEEISGADGIGLLLRDLEERGVPVDCGIVGEPTSLDVAIAEKGLMVLECTAHGKSGHAARDEGENALYRAMEDIAWFRSYQFEKVSESLGTVHMAVTVMQSGSAHNVVPDRCSFTVDVRTTDVCGNQEALDVIQEHVSSTVEPRSMRLNASGVASDHPLMSGVHHLNLHTYGSPTLSDQAQMSFPTIKFGPGDSARSHTADEYIEIDSIRQGVEILRVIVEKFGNR